MAPKKVMITRVSGIVGSSAYLHMRQSPDRFDLYGLGRRRALSDRVKDAREIDLPEDHHRQGEARMGAQGPCGRPSARGLTHRFLPAIFG